MKALECYYYTATIYEYFMRYRIGLACLLPFHDYFHFLIFQAKIRRLTSSAYFNQIFKWAQTKSRAQVARSISQTWQLQFLGPFQLPRCYICIFAGYTAVYVHICAVCCMPHATRAEGTTHRCTNRKAHQQPAAQPSTGSQFSRGKWGLGVRLAESLDALEVPLINKWQRKFLWNKF